MEAVWESQSDSKQIQFNYRVKLISAVAARAVGCMGWFGGALGDHD